MLRSVSAHHAMCLAVYLYKQKMYRKRMLLLLSQLKLIKENVMKFQSAQVSLVCLGNCWVLEKVSVRLEGVFSPSMFVAEKF